ncbi:MAG TPA: epoxide hydrolase N-terminal domain-containing protein [Candidatus Binataceae bacterium]|nr:epoxide hydrolase N-terminal domain-containing protein [Candidatus Binataceae bacterium]
MAKKEPFTIAVPEAVLEDLRDRLARTRYPRDFANPNWEYGTNADSDPRLAVDLLGPAQADSPTDQSGGFRR